MLPLDVDKVFVVHVKHGYEARRKSIELQLSRLGIPFEFMLDGDIEDVTQERIDEWFSSAMMKCPNAVMSCACKHLLIYRQMQLQGLKSALILEDDIFLSVDFIDRFNQAIEESNSREDVNPSRAWISFENSTLRFPPRTLLSPSKQLYRAYKPRCTGAYSIGSEVARTLMQIASSEKMANAIDCFVTEVLTRTPAPFELYWCHPTIAEQGSMNGAFDSMNDRRSASLWRKLKWKADKFYKVMKSRVA